MAVVFCMRFSGRARRCAFVLAGALLDTQRKCRRVRVETEHLRSADIVTARIDEYALAFCLGMIFSENRIPLFPDHALAGPAPALLIADELKDV